MELERSLQTCKQTAADCRNLQERLTALQDELSAANCQLQITQDERSSVELQLQAAESKCELLEREVLELRTSGPSVSTLKEVIENEVVARLAAIESKLADYSDAKVKELKGVVRSLSEESDCLREAVEAKDSELRSEKIKAQRELKRIREQLKTCEDTVHALKSQISASQEASSQATERAVLLQQLSTVKAEAEDEYKAQIESLTLELSNVRLEVLQYQTENNLLLTRLKSFSPQLDTRVQNVSDTISRLQTIFEGKSTATIPTSQSVLSGDESDLEEELIVEIDDQSPLEPQQCSFRSSYG